MNMRVKLGMSAVLLWAATAVQAGSVALAPESRLWLEGDSTMHAYHSKATQISAEGETAPAIGSPAGLFQPGAVKSFELSVPVEGLWSGKAGLDKNMREALKAAEHPVIRFRLLRLEQPLDDAPRLSGEEAPTNIPRTKSAGVHARMGETFLVKAQGTLSVAGQERDVV